MSIHFPVEFFDAVFTEMTEHTAPISLDDGGSLSHQSYVETSGDPTLVLEGSATLNTVRVSSREAVRLLTGVVQMDWCWLEAAGEGSDQADVIQVYNPGGTGTWRLNNCTIRAHNAAAVAGFYVADDHESHIELDHVLFWGGPYGLRIHSEGNPCTLSCNHVYFVRDSFGTAAFYIDATVSLWTNIFLCDIVDGEIANLEAIASPFDFVGAGVEDSPPDVEDEASPVTGPYIPAGAITLTSNASFAVAGAAEAHLQARITVLPAFTSETGRGRLVHPTLGAFNYEVKPDEWVNIDADIVIPPVWATTKTMGGAANVLWDGHLRDVMAEERWKPIGGLTMPASQLRMLLLVWTTPVDPDLGFVRWYPNYISPLSFYVIPVNLQVGGAGITSDDVMNAKDDEGGPNGWVTNPVTFTLKLVARI